MICPNCGGPVVEYDGPARCQICDWFNANDPRWRAQIEELKTALRPRQTRQERVDEWLPKVFTPEELHDAAERSLRCAEEGIELAQACGVDAATLHRLVDYVMGRPKGEPSQEIAGVLVTAYAVAHAIEHDGDLAFDVEMHRIWKPEIMEKIRRRQPEKRAALASVTGPRCKSAVSWRDADGKTFGPGTPLESTTNGERWIAVAGLFGSLTLSRTWKDGGVIVSNAESKLYRIVPPDTAQCGWLEMAPIDEPGPTEWCSSGKPATFKHCAFSSPVCEDHKCRCAQPPQSET